MNPIDLSTPQGCEEELERCTNGMAYLDHAYYLAVDARDDADSDWEEWEAKATQAVAEKGITATELRGRITRWCLKEPEAMEARKKQRQAKAQLDKLERWFRTAEQRSTNAQAALKKHMGGARYGGIG